MRLFDDRHLSINYYVAFAALLQKFSVDNCLMASLTVVASCGETCSCSRMATKKIDPLN